MVVPPRHGQTIPVEKEQDLPARAFRPLVLCAVILETSNRDAPNFREFMLQQGTQILGLRNIQHQHFRVTFIAGDGCRRLQRFTKPANCSALTEGHQPAACPPAHGLGRRLHFKGPGLTVMT